jgi:hypothetical protein
VGGVAARADVGLGFVDLGLGLAADRVVAVGTVVLNTGPGGNTEEHETRPRPAAMAITAATALVLPLAGTARRVALTSSS